MSVSWVRISKVLDEKKKRRFEELKNHLCRDALLVVLFGSRARSEETVISDYDLLVLTDKEQKELKLEWPVQIFIYGVKNIEAEIQSMNTIVIDAFIEGKLLCGDEKLFRRLQEKAHKEIEKRQLKKTRIGWLKG